MVLPDQAQRHFWMDLNKWSKKELSLGCNQKKQVAEAVKFNTLNDLDVVLTRQVYNLFQNLWNGFIIYGVVVGVCFGGKKTKILQMRKTKEEKTIFSLFGILKGA